MTAMLLTVPAAGPSGVADIGLVNLAVLVLYAGATVLLAAMP